MEYFRLVLISLFTGFSLGLGFWVAYFICRKVLR